VRLSWFLVFGFFKLNAESLDSGGAGFGLDAEPGVVPVPVLVLIEVINHCGVVLSHDFGNAFQQEPGLPEFFCDDAPAGYRIVAPGYPKKLALRDACHLAARFSYLSVVSVRQEPAQFHQLLLVVFDFGCYLLECH